MAPHKAVAWPPSVYEDSAILSLDEAGRFIVCRVCAESFALHGGKTPKPIVMNACFRTRAWETHKRRTRAHRRNQDNSSSRRSPRRSMSDPEGYLAQQMPRQASSPNDREGAQMIPRQARQSSTDRDWSSDPPLLPPMRIRYTREQHTRSVGDLAISLQVPVPQPLRTVSDQLRLRPLRIEFLMSRITCVCVL